MPPAIAHRPRQAAAPRGAFRADARPVSPETSDSARPGVATPVLQQQTVVDPTNEQIQRRAYEIYLSRNGRPGSALLDWFEAEQQLRCDARRAAEAGGE